MSRHSQVCVSSKPLHIVLVDHSREPLGPPWVNQVDHLGLVQVVHVAKLVASEDRTLAPVSLIEQAEFYGSHGCLHAVADPKLDADISYVSLNGAHADEEVPSDLLVGLSPNY